VRFYVVLGGFSRMVGGVVVVSVGQVCVMGRFFMVPGCMVLRGLLVVTCCVLVMLGSLVMMFR
jgi:hypothetical protein